MKWFLISITLLTLPYCPTAFDYLNYYDEVIEIPTYELKDDISEIWTIYAYCPCVKCCGKQTGITASGTNATEGRTVAADLPFGTVVHIEGIGTRIVEDRGVKGKVLDLFKSSHNECIKFGRKELRVWIK